MYDQLLKDLQKSGVGQGKAALLKPQKASDTDSTFENIILIQRQSREGLLDLAVINLSSRISRCVAASEALSLRQKWSCQDLLAETKGQASNSISEGNLSFELAPFEARLLRFEAVGGGGRCS